MGSEYDANRHLSASAGLSTTKWREPRDLTVLGAHPGYWMALVMTVCLTFAVIL